MPEAFVHSRFFFPADDGVGAPSDDGMNAVQCFLRGALTQLSSARIGRSLPLNSPYTS